MAAYIFRGRLCGYLCGECWEPLSSVTVKLYRSRASQNVAALAVADTKDTFAILDDEAVRAKASSLIAEVQADAEGRFTFELGDAHKYGGEAFEVDVYCGTVPRRKPGVGPPPPPVQFSLTTLQPAWRRTAAAAAAAWEYCLPYRLWCAIRARFGAWTICGRLTTCTNPLPIGGATVKAFDADWLQDDALGSDITDADGHFRIDYVTEDFEKTPLTPLINVECVSGPDLYFSVEYGGAPVMTEPRSAGRTPARQNVGHCFCVELCTDQVPHTPPGGPETVPHWQRVDDFDIHPAAPSPASSFSIEGYAGGPAGSYVFGGGVPLRGNCPLRNAAAPANSLEYRFLIGEWTWPGGGDGDPAVLPSLPPAALVPVTQVLATLAGWVFYNDGVNPFASAPVYVSAADAVASGWIKVDGKVVSVPMAIGPPTTVTVSQANFLRYVDLIVMDSAAISAAHPVRMPAGLPKADAGRSLTTAEQEPIRRYRLRFEVRDATTHVLVASDTLDSVILDNRPVVLALDLEELRVDACSPVSTAVHILYTVDHPHLRSFGLAISNNSGGVHPPPAMPSGAFVPPPPTANYFFRGGAGGPHVPAGNGGFAVDVSADAPCAYRVVLSWQTRHYHATPHSTEILYCK